MIVDKSEASTLFEKLTIKEIQEIENKTRNEIEKRKEDLRQMVGERYRDLIEAADTIQDMKTSVESVSKHIQKMHKFEFRVFATGSDSVQKTTSNIELQNGHNFYYVASQIRLLLGIPEKIWICIEEGNVLLATLLFLMAQHVHTNLHFGFSVDDGLSLRQSFPIVARHWASVVHFRAALLQQCNAVLKNSDIDEQKMVDCLCAIVLLTENSSCEICDEFLRARMDSLEEVLSPKKDSNCVKDQIIAVIQLLRDSLCLIYTFFYCGSYASISGKRCNAFVERISRLHNVNDDVFNLVLPKSVVWTKYIPDYVYKFRANVSVSNIPEEHLQEVCQKWLLKFRDRALSGFERLLSYVTTAKGLAAIRDSVTEKIIEVESDTHWNDSLNALYRKKLNLWNEFLLSDFQGRIKNIIELHLNGTLSVVETNIHSAVDDVKNEKHRHGMIERNLANYIWNDVQQSDAVLANFGSTLSSKRNCSLTAKARGFTPVVEHVCAVIDEQVKLLLEDLSCFADETSAVKHSAYSKATLESISTSLSNACRLLIDRILSCISKHVVDDVDASDKLLVMTFSRLCLGIVDLCPNLQIGLVGFATRWPESTDSVLHFAPSISKINDTIWQNVKSELSSKATELLSLWVASLRVNIEEKCNELILDDPSVVFKYLPVWDSVEIQEESEDGTSVKSMILVPMQSSRCVQSLLYWICQEINKIGAHVTPRNVLQDIQNDLLHCILSRFENRFVNDETSKAAKCVTQKYALQLLFDLRFVMLLVASKDSKDFSDRLQKLVTILESFVDPFDLDVFSPYINGNLKRSVNRSWMLFGPLCGPDRLGTCSSSRNATLSRQEQHNILPLSSGSRMRFSLLPLSMPSVKNANENKDDTMHHSESEAQISGSKHKRGRSSSPMRPVSEVSTPQTASTTITKSASASFFGAMSSSWFGN